MEKSDRSEPEEKAQEGLQIQEPAVCQVQEIDLDDFQSDQHLQRNGYQARNEASKLGVTHETQKLMQQEKEEPAQEVPTQDSLQKSEENKSYRQECLEFAEDEELEQKTDANIMVQQKNESSFALEQDSNQTNQPEFDAIHQICEVFAEDNPLESDGHKTVQRTAETSESISLVPDQESIQIIQEEKDTKHQECDRIVDDDPLQPKLETNLREQLKEESLEEILIVPFEDPLQTVEQEANDATENEHFQESESGPESEESHLVCLRTGQLEEVASPPLPTRICHHRTHIMQRQRLPPIPEEPDLPLSPFTEEILVRRNRRTLGARLPTLLPTGMRDYMQRVRERHIPPERQALYEELQTRCVKLFFSLLIGGILVVALYFLIDFLESKYGSNDDSNVTSPPTDFRVNLNISMNALKPELSVTDLDVDITKPMIDLEVIPVLNNMKINRTNHVVDLE